MCLWHFWRDTKGKRTFAEDRALVRGTTERAAAGMRPSPPRSRSGGERKERARSAECNRRHRTDPTAREAERGGNAERKRRRRADPTALGEDRAQRRRALETVSRRRRRCGQEQFVQIVMYM